MIHNTVTLQRACLHINSSDMVSCALNDSVPSSVPFSTFDVAFDNTIAEDPLEKWYQLARLPLVVQPSGYGLLLGLVIDGGHHNCRATKFFIDVMVLATIAFGKVHSLSHA